MQTYNPLCMKTSFDNLQNSVEVAMDKNIFDKRKVNVPITELSQKYIQKKCIKN